MVTPNNATLAEYLNRWTDGRDGRNAVAETLNGIAHAGIRIAELIAAGSLADSLDAVVGDNADGDVQKFLDVRANELLMEALAEAPVAVVVSEELDRPARINDTAPLCVAVDPLDGSSNIDTNVSVGTIFSVLPHGPGNNGPDGGYLLPQGHRQLAAGYIIYGPQTALVLTVGEGVQMFTLERPAGQFRLTRDDVKVPPMTREFAINASNFRHWRAPVRAYVDDCLDGETGPRQENFNMRWIASLVAETHRILSRGGVFLYPADSRKGYQEGRLRLVYEANPIGWLMEQAGGAASTGYERILDVEPAEAHQRVPLIFGSWNEMTRIERYHANPTGGAEHSPLFSERGLFRSRRAG